VLEHAFGIAAAKVLTSVHGADTGVTGKRGQLGHSFSTVFGETGSLRPHEKECSFMYSSTDRTLACVDCRQEFAFSASEQQFYADRQFSEPRRCPSCRAARKASRGDSGGGGYAGAGEASRGYDRAPREMFSATCASCGREAQVPFRPSGAKPVYCSDCFSPQRRG
jgi:CxxC-x17-CxxC domain-containing protein